MSLISLTSEITTNLILIIQLLIITYVARFYYKYFTRQSPLPGPFPLPLVGNLFQIGLNPAKYSMDHHDEFGDMFEVWVGSTRFVIISHPSLMEKVYAPNANNIFFARMDLQYLEKIGLQHGLIFNNNYSTWKRNRKFVVHSLMSPRFLRQFTKLSQSFFNENERFWNEKEIHIDFARWIRNFTTDMTLQTITRRPSCCPNSSLFGEEHVDPIKSKEIQKSVKFVNAVQIFIKGLIFELFIPNVLKNYFPGFYNMNKKFSKNLDWINETITDIVKKRRTEIENDDEVGSDLIDVLLTLNTPRDPNGYDEGEAPLSDPEVCATLMEVSIAGIETTANTFCYLIWFLAHHPKVIARFQEEIKEILGDDTKLQITYEDLDKFTYLDAIIKESQRIIPIVPLTQRRNAKDGDLDGKNFERDTTFLINHERIQKTPDIWKDPDEFIPERFLKGSDHKIAKNSFIPFGGGIRICPGKNMALVELKTLLILLYRKYDIELVDKVSKKPNIKYFGTNNCADMKVIIRHRNRNNV
ncbi:10203_t:CDS:2 [Funneliformis geosporum]|uniref:6420_t:CDS:1 n=1 Tax=Funneliformis geosporum TaxID=1117311 RepID=A0A9W4WZG6_9GLOM|nr:10203_t:CDS:2 [Funneliformis geosporum]CAI2183940.1 6420_t:CDS:2 [Funneliformis geosporum]